MRTIEINLYQFDELSDKAKKTVINEFSDINTDRAWWESVYEDAKTAGIEIKAFDIDRNSIRCTSEGWKTANLIIKNHGNGCETYKLAKQFIEDYDGIEDNEDVNDKIEDLSNDFDKAMGKEYLSMLRKDYEYLTSEEAIIETIRINNYEFTSEGKLN